jgi:hypothetical protein
MSLVYLSKLINSWLCESEKYNCAYFIKKEITAVLETTALLTHSNFMYVYGEKVKTVIKVLETSLNGSRLI